MDDVFVFISTFRQASHLRQPEQRAVYTVKTAGRATFLTSFTTAAAYAANTFSQVLTPHRLLPCQRFAFSTALHLRLFRTKSDSFKIQVFYLSHTTNVVKCKRVYAPIWSTPEIKCSLTILIQKVICSVRVSSIGLFFFFPYCRTFPGFQV